MWGFSEVEKYRSFIKWYWEGQGVSFFQELFLGWQKMRISFFWLFFFLSFLIIWWLNKDVFPRKYFWKINVIFWWRQTWQNFNTKKNNFKIVRKKEQNLVWNQTLNTFNQKLKNNSISAFCVTKIFMQVTKKLMFTNTYIFIFICLPNNNILKWKWKYWFKKWKKV